MKKIGKEQTKSRSEILADLKAAEKSLSAAIQGFNRAMGDHAGKVQEALADYNAAVCQADELRNECQQDIQDYIDAKSETWQEGDTGQQYAAWADSFGSLSLDEIEIEMPEPIEEPEFTARAALEEEWQEEL